MSGIICVVCHFQVCRWGKPKTFMLIQRHWYEVLPSSVLCLLCSPKPPPCPNGNDGTPLLWFSYLVPSFSPLFVFCFVLLPHFVCSHFFLLLFVLFNFCVCVCLYVRVYIFCPSFPVWRWHYDSCSSANDKNKCVKIKHWTCFSHENDLNEIK